MSENFYHTTKTIAYQLLFDDESKALSSQIQSFLPMGYSDELGDPLTYTYELLLSIFLELLYFMLYIQKINVEDPVDLDDLDNIDFDLTNFNMDLYLPTIEKKFKIIGYLVGVIAFDRDENDEYIKEMTHKRFCRIILRDNIENKHHFDTNQTNEHYGFIYNDSYVKQTTMRDVYGICLLNDKIYKIYFDRVPIINL